ncbi:MAG: hypothetical protein E6Q67_00640 [Roseateles sp.]|nr:MAG: hypothetical protein E6Q67_00640 [Roseateles sp.]
MNAMTTPTNHDGSDWKAFVLIDGVGAKGRDLAAVLGRSLDEIMLVRRTDSTAGAPRQRHRGLAFDELFTRWHGRAPSEDEWPKPQFMPGRGAYEWLLPELTLLATLVGQLGKKEIVQVLTERLRAITGDPAAQRDPMAVQNQVTRLGLQFRDVLGGISLSEAGRLIGSYQLVSQAKSNGELETFRVGSIDVVPHKAWEDFKAKKQMPPEGYVQLSTLRERLCIASDKLSEFARMGYVPGAVRVRPFCTPGARSTKFGTWYVPAALADQLLAERRAGRPMPWHGKPIMDNLKATFRTWQARRHPIHCTTCSGIWGERGAPADFEAYMEQYPPLDHGSKRHLTMAWNPGLTPEEVAAQAQVDEEAVHTAITNGVLEAQVIEGETRITRTSATRWIARRCPSGENSKSWISVETAIKQYGFTREEIVGMIERDEIHSKLGTDGAMRGIVYLLRQQCRDIRNREGYSEEQAAALAKVTVPELRGLLEGVNWRGAKGIPLSTLQAVIKRRDSYQGRTIEEAAEALDVSTDKIQALIDEGVIRLCRASWSNRVYVTDPMFERLKAALNAPARPSRLATDEWVRVSQASNLAGVSMATLIRWANDGEVTREPRPSGQFYLVSSVQQRARRYWINPRLTRATRPAWLLAEQSASAAG